MAVGRNVYLSILVVGLVFAGLSYVTNLGVETSLTILYFTCASLVLLRLIVEWRYFRRHNAPPATGLFLGSLTALAVMGSLTSRFAQLGDQAFLREVLLSLTLDIDFLAMDPVLIYSNLFGLAFALPPYVLLVGLSRRFYLAYYPRVFLFRKRFPRQAVAFFNIAVAVSLGYLWAFTGLVEASELMFVGAVLFLVLSIYVFKTVLIPARVVTRPRGSGRTRPTRDTPTQAQHGGRVQDQPVRSTSTRPSIPGMSGTVAPIRRDYHPVSPNRSSTQPSRAQPNSTTNARSTPRTNGASPPAPRSPTPASPRRTSPQPRSTSEGRAVQRPIANTPTPTRTQRPRRPQPTSRSDIEVVDAIPVGDEPRIPSNGSKLTAEQVKKLRPFSPNYSADDFRCIFCYEIPSSGSDQVVVCPHCHRPAHLREFQQWSNYSSICSYCNKDLNPSQMVRLSGRNYARVVQKLLREHR